MLNVHAAQFQNRKTRQYVSRLTTRLTNQQKTAYDRLIRALDGIGIWNKLDGLHILSAPNSTMARVNLMQASYGLTETNTPVFTANRGYSGDGAGAYLQTSFPMNTGGSAKFSQDSATIFIWVTESPDAAYQRMAAGDGSNQRSVLIPVGAVASDENIYWSLNNAFAVSQSAGNVYQTGFFVMTRRGATSSEIYRNGISLGTSANSSAALVSDNIIFLGEVGVDFSKGQLAVVGWGAQLSAAEAAQLYRVIRDCLTELRVISVSKPSLGTIPKSYVQQTIIAPNDIATWPSWSPTSIRLWDVLTNATNKSLWWGGTGGYSGINTSAGVYDWTFFDAVLSTMATNGVTELIYTFGHTPTWARADQDQTKPPDNLTNWDNFVSAIVTRAAGAIKNWELWNEPNSSTFWTGSVSDLVTLYSRARPIILGIDSSAKIIGPAASTARTTYTYDFLSAGGGAYIDVLTFHAYVNTTFPEQITSVADAFRSLLDRFGIAQKPIWSTEASTGGADVSANTIFLSRLYLLAWAAGIERSNWYAYDNASFGTLWSAAGGLNAAGIAMIELTTWTTGAAIVSAPNRVGTVWNVDLIRQNTSYRARGIWDTSGTSTYTFPPIYTQYRSVTGFTTTLSGSTVSIGTTAILLETGAGAPDTGYRLPSTDTAVSGSWTNPTNVQAADGAVASAAPGQNTTASRDAGGFSLSTTAIPDSATISKVELKVKWRVSTNASIATLRLNAKVGATVLSNHDNTAEPTTLTEQTFDVTSDRSWAATDFRDGTFFIRFSAVQGNSGTAVTFEFDYVALRVTYS